MDISSFVIKRAKQEFNLKNLKTGDVQKGIPFNKKFDVITAINVIEHLKNPKKVLKNIYSKLKNDGLFIIQLPTVNNKISKLINKYFYPDETHVFIPSIDKLNKVMNKIGFQKIRIKNPFLNTKNEHIIRSLCEITGIYKK